MHVLTRLFYRPSLELPAPLPAPAPHPEVQGRSFNSRFAPKARPVFPRTIFDNYTTKRDAIPDAAPEPAPVALPEAIPEAIPEAAPEPAPVAQPEANVAAVERNFNPFPTLPPIPNPTGHYPLPLHARDAEAAPYPIPVEQADKVKRNLPGLPIPSLGLPIEQADKVKRNLPALPTASLGLGGIHLKQV